MILQPEFPKSFVDLITTIVDRELQIDEAKALINPLCCEQLFQSIDQLKVGYIFLEDLYVFLKTNGCIVSKKQLKFINRYFGFSLNQTLTATQFIQKFIRPRRVYSKQFSSAQQTLQSFIRVIKYSIESYNQIEKQRSKVAKNVNQLVQCLNQYYPQSSNSISKPMLQEMLACLGKYSRLNYTLLVNYIIGTNSEDISVKQLFCMEKTPNIESQQRDIITNRSQSVFQKKQLKQTSSFKTQFKCVPSKNIQNLQEIMRKKKEQSSKRKVQKPQKKASLIDSSNCFSYSQLNSSLKKEKSFVFARKNKQNERKSIEQPCSADKDRLQDILKRSLRSYDGSDAIEQREAEINSLLRVRSNSRSRASVISRASSTAKLKIQQIENRVLSKAKLNSGPRVSNLVLNHEIQSRYSSVKQK